MPAVGGLISGADTGTLIKQIMEAERGRLYTRQNEQSQLEAKRKAWNDVRSALSKLSSKVDALRMAYSYRARKVTYSEETIASITAASGAALTNHSLTVSKLAQAHVVTISDAATRADANEALNVAGDLVIGAGTKSATVTINATDTLNSVADKINAAKVDVRADVVRVTIGGAEKYRLVLTANSSGTANAIQMSGTPAEGLGFKDAGGAWVSELSVAQDAEFDLNGVHFTRSTNVVSDALPGLTITLKKQGSTTATVSLDADKVLESVKAWATEVNATQDLLAKLAAYDKDTKEAGVLNGDSLIRNLQRTIRSALSTVVSGMPAGMDRLSQIGVTTGAWGTSDYGKVVVDDAKFKEMLEKNTDGVATLFGALRNNVALSASGGSISASSTGSGTPEDLINGVTSSKRFGTAGGGWESANAPTAGSPETLTINFGAAKSIDEVNLYFPTAGTSPKAFTLEYWDGTSFKQVPNIGQVKDFIGTSYDFSFDPITTSQIRLSFTDTNGGGRVQLTEVAANEFNKGTAIEMYRFLRPTLLSTTGTLDTRTDGIDKSITRIKDQITKIEEQLTKREETLRQQFARMEQAMAKMKSMGSAFAMQLAGMGQ